VYLGADTVYTVAVGADLQVSARDQNSAVGKARFNIGDEVTLLIPPAAARMLID
jgi:hypothetical protein